MRSKVGPWGEELNCKFLRVQMAAVEELKGEKRGASIFAKEIHFGVRSKYSVFSI